jgi:hypothetical protein
MKTIHNISAWIRVGPGVLHPLLTPLFSPGFTTDALWFPGTGLGILFLGLFNLAVLRMPVVSNLCLVANLIGSVYGILIVIILPAPQAFLALLAFLGAMVGAIVSRKSILEESN